MVGGYWFTVNKGNGIPREPRVSPLVYVVLKVRVGPPVGLGRAYAIRAYDLPLLITEIILVIPGNRHGDYRGFGFSRSGERIDRSIPSFFSFEKGIPFFEVRYDGFRIDSVIVIS